MKASHPELAPPSDAEMRALRARAEADRDQYLNRRTMHQDLEVALRLLKKARNGRGKGPRDWSELVTSGRLALLLAAAESEDSVSGLSCLPSLLQVQRAPLGASALNHVEYWLESHMRYSKGTQGRRRGDEFFIALHLGYAFTKLTGLRPTVTTSARWIDGHDDVVTLFDVDGPFVRFCRASVGEEMGERALRDAVREGRHTFEILTFMDIDPPPYLSLYWISYERGAHAA